MLRGRRFTLEMDFDVRISLFVTVLSVPVTNIETCYLYVTVTTDITALTYPDVSVIMLYIQRFWSVVWRKFKLIAFMTAGPVCLYGNVRYFWASCLKQLHFCSVIMKCFDHLCNHHCRVKAINSTYSERVSVALIMKHARRMRRIILSTVLYPAVPYFSTLSHKRHDFRKKKIIDHEVSFDFRYNFCLKSFSF